MEAKTTNQMAAELSAAGNPELAEQVTKRGGLDRLREELRNNFADPRPSPTYLHEVARIVGYDNQSD